jgi:hypothetical protein
MIVDCVQFFTAEVSIDVRRHLVHSDMLTSLKRFFEHLRSQGEERRVAILAGFDLGSAKLTGAEVIGYCKHLRTV